MMSKFKIGDFIINRRLGICDYVINSHIDSYEIGQYKWKCFGWTYDKSYIDSNYSLATEIEKLLYEPIDKYNKSEKL